MIAWIIILLAAGFFFLDRLSLSLRGDCDLTLRTDLISNAVKVSKPDHYLFRFEVPLENRSGREQALVIFGNVQHIPAKKEDKQIGVWCRITLGESPRDDGYFEATLVKPGKLVPLRVEMRVEENGAGSAARRLGEMKETSFEVAYGYYGRKPMVTDRAVVTVPMEAFKESPAAFETVTTPTPPRTPKQSNVVPIPTHLIYPGEDLSAVIRDYTKGIARPGDWIAIAESVVAIAQGRVYAVQTIQPGFWARRLNRFFQFNSSLASSYSMEWGIREVGLPRMLFAAVVGMLGRILGRSGDFYRIAGRSVAAIDDCTGTLPPFDKSVVLAPKDPDEVAEKIRRDTGLEVAVVDANDLGKVDILGKSSGIVNQALVDAIRDNPQGNGDEQTPMVLIRRGSPD